jgi:hypothetical protein
MLPLPEAPFSGVRRVPSNAPRFSLDSRVAVELFSRRARRDELLSFQRCEKKEMRI